MREILVKICEDFSSNWSEKNLYKGAFTNVIKDWVLKLDKRITHTTDRCGSLIYFILSNVKINTMPSLMSKSHVTSISRRSNV